MITHKTQTRRSECGHATGSSHPWHKRPRWHKRLHGWLCYQLSSWVALFWPEAADRIMYKTLSDQFDYRPDTGTVGPIVRQSSSGEWSAFASRYAWIRERFTQFVVTTGSCESRPRIVTGTDVNNRLCACDPATVDAAIDAAMANDDHPSAEGMP